MRLSEAKTGETLTIVASHAAGRTRARLDSLGLVIGEQVAVLSSSFAGLILDVKGSRLAVSRSVAKDLEVK